MENKLESRNDSVMRDQPLECIPSPNICLTMENKLESRKDSVMRDQPLECIPSPNKSMDEGKDLEYHL